MTRALSAALMILAIGPGAAGAAAPAAKSAGAGEETATIETTMGRIVIKFYDADAPKTVANFKSLAQKGFYDGTTFHRVIPGFVIQGGDPNSKDGDRLNDGQGGPGYTIAAEIKRLHKRGAVATARLGDNVNPKRDSSGSQFFICVRDLPNLDAGGYTVFAEVVEGMDIVDKIVNVKRDSRDNPIESVVMKKVTIQKGGAAPAKAEK